ncbi:MAG: NAD(P)-dependent oxidoreductase, partial [Pseudomonadota bacterium]
MNNLPSKDIRVVITGSTGRLGREVMRAFDEAGCSSTGIDSAATAEFRKDGDFVHRRADLTDYGETIDALSGCDTVVHLANISYPGFHPDHKTFTQNVGMNYNVFSAASALKCRRVIWLSSANVGGIEPNAVAPERFPITEDQAPRPSSAYALSKSVSESTAEFFGSTTATTFVGIRSTLIVYPEDHELLRADANNTELRQWHYWSYIDVRDLTGLILLAATSTNEETTIINATAADTILNRGSAEHCAEYFPETPCDIDANLTRSL